MKLAHRATVDIMAEVTERLKKIITEEKMSDQVRNQKRVNLK